MILALLTFPLLCSCGSLSSTYKVYQTVTKSASSPIFQTIPSISRYVEGYEDTPAAAPETDKASIVPSIETAAPFIYPRANILYYSSLKEKKPQSVKLVSPSPPEKPLTSPSPVDLYRTIIEPAPEYAHIEYPPQYEDKSAQKVPEKNSYDPRIPPKENYNRPIIDQNYYHQSPQQSSQYVPPNLAHDNNNNGLEQSAPSPFSDYNSGPDYNAEPPSKNIFANIFAAFI